MKCKNIIAFGVCVGLLVCLTACGSSSSSYNSSYNSSYRSNNPADYDKYGNYKPVENMTGKEIKDELTGMLGDSLGY